MYKKTTQSWFKHLDFCIIDVICLEAALLLATVLRFKPDPEIPYFFMYRDAMVVCIFISLFVSIFFDTYKDVLKKGYLQSFIASLKQAVIVIVILLFYLFATRRIDQYSRTAFFLTFVFYLAFIYVMRLIWKEVLKKRTKGKGKRSLLIITQENRIEQCLKTLQNKNYEIFRISGLAVLDRHMVGEEFHGVEVVAGLTNVLDYIGNEWIDEVYIDLPDDRERSDTMTRRISKMGVVVHVPLAAEAELVGEKKFVERLGDNVVLTTTMNYANTWQLFFKRVLDIIGGLVGTVITGILILILGPIIKKNSPGPIFFMQERVGRNGKKFKIYKFRTMYMDAEERKKELMEQNRVESGLMFKLEFDPRVIGNVVLPDGTCKTGFMEKVRQLSLDEFPQFLNVLKGDMSLVGTRPPTVEEYEIYKPHHHARLATKPGITGLWQVSGRSNIVDFEEVVRLDTQYINEWNFALDIKILFKTVKVVLKKEGSM